MSVKIHHLSCGTMCPHGRRLLTGEGGWLEPGEFCCHCLLVESSEGLVLVDTGLGLRDLSGESTRIPASLRLMMRPVMDPEHSAVRQVEKLGFKASDVRHIAVTHLDFDHAGGLEDFPQANVHVFADEHRAALNPASALERSRYLSSMWRHGPSWNTLNVEGDRWEGFGAVRALTAAETDILLVPLQGHTRGHCAVAVRDGERWQLHCGDSYFFHGEVEPRPHCPPVNEGYQRLIAHDNAQRLRNQSRLRGLRQAAQDRVNIFCAHDPVELARCRAT